METDKGTEVDEAEVVQSKDFPQGIELFTYVLVYAPLTFTAYFQPWLEKEEIKPTGDGQGLTQLNSPGTSPAGLKASESRPLTAGS